MRIVFIVGLLFFILASGAARAQTPHIVGTWRLNSEASELPGPAPQLEVRRYALTEDGFLVGTAVSVNADGNPGFLQFTAKTDGKDYPEYNIGTLSRLQASGEATPLAYSETQLDEYTIEWFDKRDGRVYASGTRSVSADGQTMTVVAEFSRPDGEVEVVTIIYDRVATAEQSDSAER